MFLCEQEALEYINENKSPLLLGLREMEEKTIFTDENTVINVIWDGKRIIKIIKRYGDRKSTDVLKGIIDIKQEREIRCVIRGGGDE